MKKSIFIAIILAVAVLYTAPMWIPPFVNITGGYVDLYKMEDSYHEYGYWKNIIDAYARKPPLKTVKIPLVPNEHGKLEYAYYPTNVEFAKFLVICTKDTSRMNLKCVYDIVGEHHIPSVGVTDDHDCESHEHRLPSN